jgi:hypothetical protein
MKEILTQALSELKDEPKNWVDSYRESLENDIRLNGVEQYSEFAEEDFIEDYENYISDKIM